MLYTGLYIILIVINHTMAGEIICATFQNVIYHHRVRVFHTKTLSFCLPRRRMDRGRSLCPADAFQAINLAFSTKTALFPGIF